MFRSINVMPVTELLKLLFAENQLVFSLISEKNKRKRYFNMHDIKIVCRLKPDSGPILLLRTLIKA